MAPGLTGKGDRIYQAGHNLIKAHAKAYHIYHNEFKRAQKGTWILSDFVVPSGNVCDYQNYYSELIFEMSVFFVLKTFLHYCIANANSLIKKNHLNSGIIGITLNTDWQVPEDPNSERDLQASHRAIHFMYGWFLNPVMKGDYPAIMKKQVDRKSRAQGYIESRLPEFSATEKDYIKGIHLNFTKLHV